MTVKTMLDAPEAAALRFAKSAEVPATDVQRAIEYIKSLLGNYQPLSDGPINIKSEFHAAGNGVTEDRATIILADVAAASSGRPLFFPTGIYSTSAAIAPSTGVRWFTGSKHDTILRTTSATENILTVDNNFVTIDGFQFASSVPRSAGYYVDSAGTNFTLRNWYSNAAFQALRLRDGSSLVRIQEGEIVDTVSSTGVSIRVAGGLDVSFESVTATGSTAPFSHLYVTHSGDMTFDEDCVLIGAAQNMVLAPGVGDVVASLKFRGWLDQATLYNLHFNMQGGSVVRCSFRGAWFSQAGMGNVVASGTTGGIDGVDFDGCENYDAAYLYSLDASAGIVKNIQIDGGRLSGADVCAILAEDVNGLQVTGVRGGDAGGWSGNALFMQLSGATDHVLVDGCDMRDSTAKVTNTASGTDIVFGDNLGYDAALSPAQITSDTDDYAPTGIHGANVLRLSTNASRNLTGIVAPARGKRLTLHNVGSNPLVLVDDATSTAANRFALKANRVLHGDESVELEYDTTTAHWRAVSGLTGPVTISQMGDTSYGPQLAIRATGVNFNSANTDTAIPITLPAGFTRYRIAGVCISGASASLTTATAGVFTAPGGGGTTVIATAPITVSTASESTNNNLQVLGVATVNTQSFNSATLYFRITTPQGSAATADVTVLLAPMS